MLSLAVAAATGVASCSAAGLTSRGPAPHQPDGGIGLTAISLGSPSATPWRLTTSLRGRGGVAGPEDWWNRGITSLNPDLDTMTNEALRDQAGYVGWLEDLSLIAAATAAEAALSSAPRAHYTRGGSTGACGGATNGADQYIARESGGDPSAANASGAYGCYQIMPGTWAASCSDLGSEGGSSAATQAQCASRLPASAWGG